MRPDLSGVDPLDYNLATRFTVGDLLARSAQLFPDRVAVVDPSGRQVSYADLDTAANAVGRSLLERGLERQQPVALLMGNSWRFVASFFGCAKAGLVAMPVNVVLSPGDIAWIVADSGATAVVADRANLPLLAAVLATNPAVEHVIVSGEDPPPEVAGRRVERWDDLMGDGSPLEVLVEDRDIVHCLYTSGTTARPKGVLASHLAVHVAVLSNALEVGHPRGDSWSVLPVVLPLFHTTALDTLLLPILATGGTAVLSTGFEPEAFLHMVERYRATHVMLLPMMYGALLSSPAISGRDLSSVRLCIYAMAPMADERIADIAAAFPRAKVLLGSGQTECVPATVFQWPSHQGTKSASWGAPVTTVQTRIMDVEGNLVEPGVTGEIVYRGPHTMAGYWNNRDANVDAFAHGWFHSSDVGHMDGQGVVWFTDRLKDIVKSGGENVSSVEVERVLLGSPQVAECAVVGTPDARWGEAVTAVVVPADGGVDPGELERQLVAHCRQHLARFAVPKRVVVVAALPKTATGKVQKADVRAQLVP